MPQKPKLDREGLEAVGIEYDEDLYDATSGLPPHVESVRKILLNFNSKVHKQYADKFEQDLKTVKKEMRRLYKAGQKTDAEFDPECSLSPAKTVFWKTPLVQSSSSETWARMKKGDTMMEECYEIACKFRTLDNHLENVTMRELVPGIFRGPAPDEILHDSAT